MSIRYRIVQRGQPGVVGGGTQKYYAQAVSTGELGLEELTAVIERMCTVNGADIRAVLYALVTAMQDGLAKGEIVRLEDLGSLRVGVHSSGYTTPQEVDSHAIEESHILFSPGTRLKSMLKLLQFEKGK